MITVLHYPDGKNPEIFFGITETKEKKILASMKKSWNVSRASPEDWYGQDIPEYPVHHWCLNKLNK